jgi:hypothetical protein
MARALAQVDRRLADVERERVAPVPRPAAGPMGGAAAPIPDAADLPAALGLVGRTVLALGGAYLLRALTEAGALPQSVGIPVGLAYALSFVLLAHRAGAAGRSPSAAFHCLAAALIGYPLLWETTVRLRFLEPAASALAVFVFTLALLWVAWRWRLTSAAWVVHVAIIATSFALMGGTRAVLPYTAGLAGFALVSLWLAYEREISALSWVSAAAADLAVLLLAFGAWVQKAVASSEGASSVLMLFFLGYLGSFFRRNLVEGRPVSVFEMIQASLVTFVGYGAAMTLANHRGGIALASLCGIGAALACGLGGLGRFPRIGSPSRRNALFFAALSLPIALLATAPIPGTPYLWSAAAAGAYLLGSRVRRIEISLHGGAYLFTAAIAGGLLARVAHAFVLPASRAWPAFSPSSSIPLAAAILCCVFAVPEEPSWKSWELLPKVLRLLIAVLGTGAAAAYALVPIAGQPGLPIDEGSLAALRTALLSIAAIGLGALGGKGWREALVLLYPLLVLTGIKLVLEDFRLGRAETLFAALACYGAALILAPRLARGRRSISHQ